MVEAATNWPETTRFMRGLPASSLERASQSSCEMPPTKSSGRKDGALAMARTSPFVTSMTTAAPELHVGSARLARVMPSARACSAAFWRVRSIVSSTSEPASGGTEVE